MARNIGPTVEILMKRVQQEGGRAVDPDFATKIYSYCTQIVNARVRRVISSTTLNTPKEKLLFHYRIAITDAIDILSIRESGRRVEPCKSLDDFGAYDIDWFRKIDGTRFDAWFQLGRDLLILYPGQAAASSVTVDYTKLLTVYTDFESSYNTANELDDEDVEMAINLAEIALLVRFRQLVPLNRLLEMVSKKYFLMEIKR